MMDQHCSFGYSLCEQYRPITPAFPSLRSCSCALAAVSRQVSPHKLMDQVGAWYQWVSWDATISSWNSCALPTKPYFLICSAASKRHSSWHNLPPLSLVRRSIENKKLTSANKMEVQVAVGREVRLTLGTTRMDPVVLVAPNMRRKSWFYAYHSLWYGRWSRQAGLGPWTPPYSNKRDY